MGFQQCATLAVGFILGSALVEVSLRVIEITPLWHVLPVAEVALYGPDADTGYAPRAGVTGIWTTENRARIAINSLGLRDRPDRHAMKVAGERRWAVVGDSYVEALQVPNEQTFVAIAEDLLATLGQGPVKVLNLGLSGAGLAVIVERLRTFADRLSLDGAVVMLDANKLVTMPANEKCGFPEYVFDSGGNVAISYAFRQSKSYLLRTGAIGAVIYWACDSSRLARALNNRKNVGLLAELNSSAVTTMRMKEPHSDCDKEAFECQQHLWRMPTTASGFNQQRLKAVLESLAAVSQEHGIPVIVTVRNLPNACQDTIRSSKALSKAIRRKLEDFELLYLDLNLAISEHLPQGIRLEELQGFGIQKGSGHLNRLGHEVYGRVIAAAIKESVNVDLPP